RVHRLRDDAHGPGADALVGDVLAHLLPHQRVVAGRCALGGFGHAARLPHSSPYSSPPSSRSPNSFILVWSDLRLICKSLAARVTLPEVSSSALMMWAFSTSAVVIFTTSLSEVPGAAAAIAASPAEPAGAPGCFTESGRSFKEI